MAQKTLNVTINGTGFAAEFTAGAYGLIPHQNGVDINLAGVCSGRIENARKFAEAQDVDAVFAVLMREHGITDLFTFDTDFRAFSWVNMRQLP